MRIAKEEILGYTLDNKVVCPECIESDEESELNSDDLILESDTEDDMVFCDRCKKKL